MSTALSAHGQSTQCSACTGWVALDPHPLTRMVVPRDAASSQTATIGWDSGSMVLPEFREGAGLDRRRRYKNRIFATKLVFLVCDINEADSGGVTEAVSIVSKPELKQLQEIRGGLVAYACERVKILEVAGDRWMLALRVTSEYNTYLGKALPNVKTLPKSNELRMGPRGVVAEEDDGKSSNDPPLVLVLLTIVANELGPETLCISTNISEGEELQRFVHACILLYPVFYDCKAPNSRTSPSISLFFICVSIKCCPHCGPLQPSTI
ncbi:hypothetical protein B0H14DRAFT_2629983 [Mycena olivaceomarginata]|nr:hypothetical protein B0H14DRAFT_2629983 [Mycena olivaceomarginata]